MRERKGKSEQLSVPGKSGYVFRDQFKRYTTYKLPTRIKALIYTLAGLLTLSVAINIYVMFAGGKKEPQRVTEVYPITTPETTEETTTMETTTGAVEAVKYYDVPLSAELQDYICFILNFEDAHEDISLPLILAIIEVESNYTSDVISETNDYGLMQINECNHDWLAEQYDLGNMLDEHQNIRAGIIILNDCMNNSPNMHAALTAYNRGLGGAQELWEQGIYETEYSRKVLDAFEEIRRTK